MAFAPTGSDLHRTVFVDPGHGGPDPGAIGTRADGTAITEKDATLKVGLALSDKLRADGYRVVLSRTADVSVAALSDDQVRQGAITNSAAHLDQLARVACANAAHADVLLSIHFDAFDDPSAGGAETFFDDAREFAAANQKLANLLQQSVIASFRHAGWDTFDRGIWSDADTGAPGLTQQGDNYGRLLILGPASPGWLDRPSAMPGALVEPLFITDPAEGEAMATPDGRAVLASGLEQGLVGFLQSTTG